ncbi:MAG TPA: site-2 protease family protein [Thermoanaerobaculia bacterium]|nr:site-2 protease family protein [Thermoanaerobaculia bacterium]
MSPDKILQIVIQIVVLLFAVSFHESAHGFVAMKCGDNTARDLGRITMNPLKHIDPIGSLFFPALLAFSGLPVFGWAKPVPVSLRGVRNPRRANLLVSAAGPLSNLLLAVVFAGAVVLVKRLYSFEGDPGILRPLFIIAASSVLVNVSLAVFNLFPIPPLDGFGVVESLAPPAAIPAVLWLRRFGFLILVVMMFTGILGFFMRPVQQLVLRWLSL